MAVTSLENDLFSEMLGARSTTSLALNFKSHLAFLGKPHFLQLQNDTDMMAREPINKQNEMIREGLGFQVQAQCCCEAELSAAMLQE